MACQSHNREGRKFAGLSGHYSNLEMLEELVKWMAELKIDNS